MLATLLLLAAASAGPTKVSSFEDVKALCSALKAGEPREVEVTVPSKGFTWGRYRVEDEELELDGDRPLRAAEGTLLLDLHQTDDVAFKASAAQRDEWKQKKQAGELSLDIVFLPSSDGCSGSVHARQLRLAGSAVSWKIVDAAGKLLAAADADARPLTRLDGKRAARVQSVAIEGEPPLDDDGRSRLPGLQGALDECVKGAQRTGSVVLSFAARSGRLHDVQVAVDGLRDEAVAGCMQKAAAGTAIDGVASGKGTATIAVE